MAPSDSARYQYSWPLTPLEDDSRWVKEGEWRTRNLPESSEELARDSRWPAFFPSPMCLVTTGTGADAVLEKVVGASIVNRFPYVIALSFCRVPLSERHHQRSRFMETLEKTGTAAVQFLPPGDALDAAMRAILETSEEDHRARFTRAGLPLREASGADAPPSFRDAYMIYDAELVRPNRDFDGAPIYDSPWADVGSHRVYFLEIRRIRLREDIAHGRSQIHWRSLPRWDSPPRTSDAPPPAIEGYQKGYQADYRFPAAGT
ncbi:MAG: hypothetical protein ABMA01_03475, partial [Chthoniobacteraceae bacterium]